MKKIFLFFVFMAAIINSAKAYDFEVDGIYYDVVSISDLTCEVTSSDKDSQKYTGDIVIPSTVNYNGKTLSVTSIGSDAFYQCISLTSINIPDAVTSIGKYAFYGCSGLTSINIPDAVTSIGKYAFYGCSGLTSINIPDAVTSIGEFAFSDCSGLTSINIPDAVTSIGEFSFSGCSDLTSIIIPDAVTSIGNYAFYSCSGLTSVTIGNGVTSIGIDAFYYCSGMTSITVGNVCGLRYLVFYNVENITLSADYSDDIICGISYSDKLSKLTIKTNKKLAWEYDSYSEPVTNKQYINVEVVVPKEMLSYYQTADIWKNFWNLKGSDEDSDTPEEPKTCEAPTISFDNETRKLKFESATDGTTFKYTITSDDMAHESKSEGDVTLGGVYDITAYAIADGMNSSEKTTAKLCWVSATIESDGILTAKTDRGVIVSSKGGSINISGTISGETIEVYNVGGSKLKAVKANGGNTSINGLQDGSYIIKIGGTRVKIIL